MPVSSRGLFHRPPEIVRGITRRLSSKSTNCMNSAQPTLNPTVDLPRRRDLPASGLLALPLELIFEIADYLPPDAILALKFTHRALNDSLPLAPRMKKTILSNCAKRAIRTYLAKPDHQEQRTRCFICKKSLPVDSFHSASSPACIPTKISNSGLRPEVLELPPRFCSYHVGRLTNIMAPKKGGRNEWVSTVREMCMHCGSIRGWSKCNCKCDSCWTRSVRTYTRYLNNAVECKDYRFWRDTSTTGKHSSRDRIEGRLMVRETCRDRDGSLINLPVRFEDAAPRQEPAAIARDYRPESRPSHRKTSHLKTSTDCSQQ